jgi:hypothetical protein
LRYPPSCVRKKAGGAGKNEAAGTALIWSKELCKIEVRHILFKKMRFLIFLNIQIAAFRAVIYCLKRKN